MQSRIKILALIIGFSLLLFQCSSALKIPTLEDVQQSGVSLDTLIKGRNTYIQNCGNCHSLYLPDKFSKASWSENVNKMQKRAKIDDDQKELIIKYLTSKSRN